jgi:FkbM family methyltransferase
MTKISAIKRNASLALGEIKYLVVYPLRIKNWITYLKNYYGLIDSEFVTIKLRNGCSIQIRSRTPDRIPINNIFIKNCFFIKPDEIKNAQCIIDIGGHIGVFSLFASSLAPKAVVFTYEPEPINYDLLTKNIALNNRCDKIKAFMFAVAGERGQLKLYVYDSSIAHSAIRETTFEGKESVLNVPAISLEDIFIKNNISECDLLKINAEGSEYGLLMNASETLLSKIKAITVQCHFIDEHLNICSLEEFLVQKGFFTFAKKGDILMVKRKSGIPSTLLSNNTKPISVD